MPSNPVESPRVIPKAALIGGGQPAGQYRVHAVVTRHPVVRADLPRLLPADIVTRANFDLVVFAVKRSLVTLVMLLGLLARHPGLGR